MQTEFITAYNEKRHPILINTSKIEHIQYNDDDNILYFYMDNSKIYSFDIDVEKGKILLDSISQISIGCGLKLREIKG